MKSEHPRRRTSLSIMYIALVLPAVLVACQTVPTEIPEDASAPRLFQMAQSEVDDNNFPAALVYYETALERFQDDAEVTTIALYEIGFIHYRQGRYDEAMPYFEQVLEQYDEEGGQRLPQWPQLMSRRFLEETG